MRTTEIKYHYILIFILVGIFGLAGDSLAATHYVSPSGSAASWSSCTTSSNPCSLEMALSGSGAVAGDTAILLNGLYDNKVELTPVNSGQAGNPIIFEGESLGAIIQGPDNFANTVPVFELGKTGSPLSHIIFRNLTIKGGGTVTFRIGSDSSTSDITIERCHIYDTYGDGKNNPGCISVQPSASNIYIKNNEIGPTRSASGIYLFSCADSVWIENNYLHDFTVLNTSLSQQDSHGIHAKHTVTAPVYIRKNWIRNATMGMLLNLNDSFIENNLLYNVGTYFGGSPNSAIQGANSAGYASTIGFSRNTIRHNTVIATDSAALSFQPYAGATAQSNVIRDNILMHKSSQSSTERQPLTIWTYNISGTHNSTIDHNLYYQNGTNRVAEYGTPYTMTNWNSHFSDSGSLGTQPIFRNSTSPTSPLDFALQTGSPGKGAASDGKDMGADVLLVGTSITSTPSDATAPASPMGLTVI